MKKGRIFVIVILALIVLYMLGPAPPQPVYDLQLPQVPSVSNDLEAYVAEQESKHKLKEHNEAQIIWYNDTLKNQTEYVLLYLHGFSASRMEGAPLHHSFIERYGCNAYFARISDHGIDTSDAMYNFTADRAWNSAKEALAIAKQLGNKVIIMSTSTGGTLALKLAAEYPGITGLINCSPNIKINDPTAFLLNDPWGGWIAKTYLNSDFRTLEGKDDYYKKYWYVSYRVESIVALEQLVETTMTKSTFYRIKIPVLNMYYFKDKNNQDDIVKVSGIIDMHMRLATPKKNKRLVAIENAGTHIIGSDRYCNDFDLVRDETFKFTEEVLQLTPINE